MSRILLVEDDPKQAKHIRALMMQYGFETDIAERVAEAIDLVRVGVYEAVLLDWQLPDGEGPSVALKLRATGVATPILMLTGRASIPDKVRALESGCDDYVVKPFDVRELAARVTALIRRSVGEPGKTLRCGRITLHLGSYEVFVGGARVCLTHLELRLLASLMNAGGRVVRRAELLSSVWGMKTGGTSNVIDVHVAHLREKLGVAGSQIETERGVGYRLKIVVPTLQAEGRGVWRRPSE